MYRQIQTYDAIEMYNGSMMSPIVSLEDISSKQLVHIINDDHCYVCCIRNEQGTYSHMTHIFKELFEMLVKLPTPN